MSSCVSKRRRCRETSVSLYIERIKEKLQNMWAEAKLGHWEEAACDLVRVDLGSNPDVGGNAHVDGQSTPQSAPDWVLT